ncbi:hypothetical protein MRB53_039397 [Persea americana]|nr:hypothetical protein MRB53_039397 [Persea americana]
MPAGADAIREVGGAARESGYQPGICDACSHERSDCASGEDPSRENWHISRREVMQLRSREVRYRAARVSVCERSSLTRGIVRCQPGGHDTMAPIHKTQYPDLQLEESSQSHPYFLTRNNNSEDENESVAYERPSRSRLHEETHGETDLDDDEEQEIDGIPFDVSGLLDDLLLGAPSLNQETDIETELDEALDATIAGALEETGEGRRGAARGRGRGRGRGKRGRPRGFGLGPGSQGGKVRVRGGPRGRPRGSKGGARGDGDFEGKRKRSTRNLAEPSAEFKSLQDKATTAFLDQRYEEALDHARQAIQINPEIFAAHSLLSQIYLEMGKQAESLAVLWSGAHTKREVGVWWEVANRTAELGSGESTQNQLKYCYSQINRLDPNDFDARKLRLAIYVDEGATGRAIRETKAMLRIRPHDLDTLQSLAELCIVYDDAPRAKKVYAAAIDHYKLLQNDGFGGGFSFSDLNIYLELFAHDKEWQQGLIVAKSISRWLCGRRDETYWDDVQDNDCEWDLDDEPRRVLVEDFIASDLGSDAYGQNLPPEIRAKMGIFRMQLGDAREALNHFACFNPDDNSNEAPVHDYPDLFLDIANVLLSKEEFRHALDFYEPLERTQDALEVSAYKGMAFAHKALGDEDASVNYFERVLEVDSDDADAHIELARVLEARGDSIEAYKHVSEVIRLGKSDSARQAKLSLQRPKDFAPDQPDDDYMPPAESDVASDASSESEGEDEDEDYEGDEGGQGGRSLSPIVNPIRKRPATGRRPGLSRAKETKAESKKLRREELLAAHDKLLAIAPAMRSGDKPARATWMSLAQSLVDTFRKKKIFFPSDKYVRFLGYGTEARRRALKKKTNDSNEMEQMASRLEASLDVHESVEQSDFGEAVPTDWEGITFDSWRDVFCELGLCYAMDHDRQAAYEVLTAASDANVFYHDEAAMTHIQVCIIAAALQLSDEERLCNTARWFMRQYPHATDTYRLFAAVMLLYDGEPNWYNSGPTQKFVMRQIKALDFALLDEEGRKLFKFSDQERRTYTKSMEDRRAVGKLPTSLDPALLVMYGHLLVCAGSHQNALNYYFRAYAVDPDNAMTLLSIALAYMQHSIKRQCENRHYFMLQGIAFFKKYQKLRLDDIRQMPDRRESINKLQELEYNEGRLYHSIGLLHLATPAYERCLALPDATASLYDVELTQDVPQEAGFKREAAYALSQIYAIGGDMMKARELTRKWLVF